MKTEPRPNFIVYKYHFISKINIGVVYHRSNVARNELKYQSRTISAALKEAKVSLMGVMSSHKYKSYLRSTLYQTYRHPLLISLFSFMNKRCTVIQKYNIALNSIRSR